ncbi:MAG: PepSY domain-containing protein, partial [Bryobacteraceae bacterium]|nr:PepSY domain-containing protein [Bryobacteraceae bacterium]
MFKAKTVRTWYKIHKWTSLICTVFLLLLCVTGLPLIFYHELEHLLGNAVEPQPMPAGTPLASLDAVVEAGRKLHPDLVLQYLSWDPDEPNVVSLS